MSDEEPKKAETLEIRISKRMSAIASLRELIFIMAAVAVTVSFSQIAPDILERGGRLVVDQKFVIATLLILNIIRFSHGNIRLLDDTFMYKTEHSGKGGHKPMDRTGVVGVDFIFCFVMTALFSFMAYIITDFYLFFQLFGIVLLIDVIWIFITDDMRQPVSLRKTRRWWLINNVAFLFGLIITLIIAYLGNDRLHLADSKFFIFLCSLLVLNMLIDFSLNWFYYFPKHYDETDE